VRWAVETWHHDKAAIVRMQDYAMSLRFSWERSAREYETVYRAALECKG
jgi:starch synthase